MPHLPHVAELNNSNTLAFLSVALAFLSVDQGDRGSLFHCRNFQWYEKRVGLRVFVHKDMFQCGMDNEAAKMINRD
jgi:hypothetical protein